MSTFFWKVVFQFRSKLVHSNQLAGRTMGHQTLSLNEGNLIGEEQDVWLEQQSPLSNKWIKVVLIFGFTDDLSACRKLVELYKPIDALPYRCTAAN